MSHKKAKLLRKKNYLQKKGEDLLKTGQAPLSSKDRDLDYTTRPNDDFNEDHLEEGDACPICHSRLDLIEFTADGYAQFLGQFPGDRGR
jgi:hypothetical protein